MSTGELPGSERERSIACSNIDVKRPLSVGSPVPPSYYAKLVSLQRQTEKSKKNRGDHLEINFVRENRRHSLSNNGEHYSPYKSGELELFRSITSSIFLYCHIEACSSGEWRRIRHSL